MGWAAELCRSHVEDHALVLPQKMLKGQGFPLVQWLPKSRGASPLAGVWRDKAICPLGTGHVWLRDGAERVSPALDLCRVGVVERRGRAPEVQGDSDSLEGHAAEGGLGAATGIRSWLSQFSAQPLPKMKSEKKRAKKKKTQR